MLGHFEVRGKVVLSLNIYVQLQQLSPIHKLFGFKVKFKFKSKCDSVMEEDNLTNVLDEDRDGMETSQQDP